MNKVMHKYGIASEKGYVSRIFPAGLKYQNRIHEQINSNLPRLKVQVEVHHDGYFQTAKSNRNIPLLKRQLEESPNDPYYFYQIAKEYNGIGNYEEANAYYNKAYCLLTKRETYAPNVIVDYLYNIVARGSFQDGVLIVEGEQQYLHDYPDFHFVCGVFYLEYILQDISKNAHLMSRIEESYIRCLQIGETERYDSIVGRGSFASLFNLGTYYEVTGAVGRTHECYREAAAYDYQPALLRLKHI